MNIQMLDQNQKVITTANVDDAVQFKCGQVPTVTQYEFRVITPELKIVLLPASGNMSSVYSIKEFGKFQAQCRICPPSSAEGSSCQEWEPVPGLPAPTASPDPRLIGPPIREEIITNDLDIMLR